VTVTAAQAKSNLQLVLILLIPIVAVMIFPFSARDGDGALYAAIGTEAVQRGFAELFRLGWYGNCKIYQPGSLYYDFFLEHPPGLFVLPWLLHHAGAPANKALYIADLIYQLVAWCAAYLLVRRFASRFVSQWTMIAMVVMPISFLYSVRSTQETPLLMSMLLLLVCIAHRSRYPVWMGIGVMAVSSFAVALKGAMAIPPVFVAVGSRFFLQSGNENWPNRLVDMVRLAVLCLVGGFAAVAVIELGHREFAGNPSFWEPYWRLQITERAMSSQLVPKVGWHKLLQVPTYLLHIAWYSCPFVVTALYSYYKFIKANDKPGSSSLWHQDLAEITPLVALCLSASMFYVLGMSAFDRTSQRYIFPVYYLIGMVAFFVSYSRWPGLFHKITTLAGMRPLFLAAWLWASSRVLAVLSNAYLTGH
jgi:hypothetical protein